VRETFKQTSLVSSERLQNFHVTSFGGLRRGDLKMPADLPSPTATQPLILCARYIAGIATLLVALALFKLRLVRAAHATARLGERIGGGPPVFS
jgi:hypothetical protein